MLKNRMEAIIKYIVKHSKFVFPIIVIVAIALTVSIALKVGNADDMPVETSESIAESSTEESAALEEDKKDAPMAVNEDGAIHTLIATFYNAMALGDMDVMNSVCDEIALQDQLRYQEIAKYIETYPTLEIYTKSGPEEGSLIAFIYYKVIFVGHEEEFPGYKAHYVCLNEEGEYYIKTGENSEAVNQYIGEIMAQDDVIEFHNRVTAEYNDLITAQPELHQYLSEVNSTVSAAVGTQLADIKAAETADADAENAESTEGQPEEGTENQGDEATTEEPVQEPDENVVLYATATTTVNVRSSDSEQADKLGKVSGGTRLQILEQKVNGWTKVSYEGKDGYIKSEFLELSESAEGMESIGSVTATTNINVRAAASETAEKLGVLVGGDTVELLANENGWCKINYEGQVGYVKADYVEQ